MDAFGFTGIKRRNDIGMQQTRRRAHFLVKAIDRRFVTDAFIFEHFDRDGAVHSNMLGQVNFAHAAGSNDRLDRVVPQLFGECRISAQGARAQGARAQGFVKIHGVIVDRTRKISSRFVGNR